MFLELKYAYLGLCTPFAFVWFLFLIFSRETRVEQFKKSLARAPMGILVDLFYFTDYWKPESVLSVQFGGTRILIESMLFAFFFGGIAVIAYKALCRTKNINLNKKNRVDLIIHYSTIVLASLLLASVGINSIFATAIGFGFSGIIIIWNKKATLESALFTSIFMTTLLFSVYCLGRITFSNIEEILFNWWSLYDTSLDIRFVNVPLTEIAWALCYGFTAGARHNLKN